MFSFSKKVKSLIEIIKCETKKHVFFRYLLLILILVGYLGYTIHQFGAEEGLLVTFLTWSFFVFCTPIADAGFLVDFPARLLIKVRMLHSELFVWGFAAALNIFALLTNSGIYGKTILLKLFHKILTTPFPYWGIIILSAAGTFFSIYFGDELLDVARHKDRVKYKKHKNKHRIIILIFLIIMVLVFYNFLLKSIGLNLPLF